MSSAEEILAEAERMEKKPRQPSAESGKAEGPHTNGGDTAPGLNVWDAGDDIELPPPRGWLLGNVFARRFMSSLLAEGGTGKTALRCAQILSLVTGRELTGEHVFERCRVLIVSLEDDADELRRRILAVRLHHKIDLSEIKGRLFLSAPSGHGGRLMTLGRSGQLTRGEMATHLETVILKHKIDLVCIDPFVKAHGVPENDNSLIDQVAQLLTDLSTKHDIAIDAPHHISKGGSDPGNADRGRGASAMKDAGRLVYTLSTMSPEEAKDFGIPEGERRNYVRVDSGKVNITKWLSTSKWFQLVSVPLGNATALYPNGDEVQVCEAWQPPETWADLSVELLNTILTAIDRGLPDGNFYTDAARAGEREAWRGVVKHTSTKTEGQAREIIRTWVRNGLLFVEAYDNPKTRKPVNGLKVNHEKRPG